MALNSVNSAHSIDRQSPSEYAHHQIIFGEEAYDVKRL